MGDTLMLTSRVVVTTPALALRRCYGPRRGLGQRWGCRDKSHSGPPLPRPE